MKPEINENGNTLRRGFSFTGDDGYGQFESWLGYKDYREFYYDAPYYWGVISIKQMKIYTYTEGDTLLIKCKDKKSFIKEIKDHMKFLKDSGYKVPEAEEILKEVEA